MMKNLKLESNAAKEVIALLAVDGIKVSNFGLELLKKVEEGSLTYEQAKAKIIERAKAKVIINGQIHMNLTNDKPVKRFIFQGDSIYAVFSFGENGMTEYEVISMNPENLKWVSEYCKKNGAGVTPNYNRISPGYMNLWRELIGKPPINHTIV